MKTIKLYLGSRSTDEIKATFVAPYTVTDENIVVEMYACATAYVSLRISGGTGATRTAANISRIQKL